MTRARRAIETGSRVRVLHVLRGRAENGTPVTVQPGVLASVRRVEEGVAVVRTNAGFDVRAPVEDLEPVR